MKNSSSVGETNCSGSNGAGFQLDHINGADWGLVLGSDLGSKKVDKILCSVSLAISQSDPCSSRLLKVSHEEQEFGSQKELLVRTVSIIFFKKCSMLPA